jgi:hypothetical protein
MNDAAWLQAMKVGKPLAVQPCKQLSNLDIHGGNLPQIRT